VAIDQDRRTVAKLPIRGWLADCSVPFREEFLALARPMSVPAGSVVYRAGDVARDLFGVCSGVVLLQCRFVHPDAEMLHMLRAGEWIGTMDWLSERTRRFSVVASTDVELIRIPGDEMLALLHRRPEGFIKLGHNAGYGLDVAIQCAVDLLIKDASARCAAALLRLAGRRWATEPDADLPSEIPVTQAQLAMLCNVSRKTFSRVVGEFAKQGLVTVGYKSLTVNDPVRLRRALDLG
jgi:CRP-like cAMP-binding protein